MQSEFDFTIGNSRPSQAMKILNHLKSGHRLTPLDALDLFGCFRLAARIFELRKQGWNIQERTIATSTGKKVAEYSLT